jgi:transcriptional regulator with XRE-family HTH domain
VARPRTVKPRSLRHAALGQAIEVVIAKNAELTADSVSRDSGLDEKQIGMFIRGQGNPRFDTLMKLCAGLHVTPAELFRHAEEMYEKRGGG